MSRRARSSLIHRASQDDAQERTPQGRKAEYRTSQAGEEDDEVDAEALTTWSDPYGSKALGAFLKHYQRISIADACQQTKEEFDLSDLTVWVNRTGKWGQVKANNQWRKAKRSICRAVVTEVFGLSAEQYEAMRDALDDHESTDPMGIYQHKKISGKIRDCAAVAESQHA